MNSQFVPDQFQQQFNMPSSSEQQHNSQHHQLSLNEQIPVPDRNDSQQGSRTFMNGTQSYCNQNTSSFFKLNESSTSIPNDMQSLQQNMNHLSCRTELSENHQIEQSSAFSSQPSKSFTLNQNEVQSNTERFPQTPNTLYQNGSPINVFSQQTNVTQFLKSTSDALNRSSPSNNLLNGSEHLKTISNELESNKQQEISSNQANALDNTSFSQQSNHKVDRSNNSSFSSELTQFQSNAYQNTELPTQDSNSEHRRPSSSLNEQPISYPGLTLLSNNGEQQVISPQSGQPVQSRIIPSQSGILPMPNLTTQQLGFSSQPVQFQQNSGVSQQSVLTPNCLNAQNSNKQGFLPQHDGPSVVQQSGFTPQPKSVSQQPGFLPQPNSMPQQPGFSPQPSSTPQQHPGFPSQSNSVSQQLSLPPQLNSMSQQPGFPSQSKLTPQQPGFPPQPNSTPQQHSGFPPQPNSMSQQPGFPLQPSSVSQQPGFPSQQPRFPPQSGIPSLQQSGFPPQHNSADSQQGFPLQPKVMPQQPGFPLQPSSTPQQHPGFPPQPNSMLQQPGFPPQPSSTPQQHPGFPPQPSSTPQKYPGFPPQPSSTPQQHPGFPPQPSSTPQKHPGFPPQPSSIPQQHPGFPLQSNSVMQQPGFPPQPSTALQNQPGFPPKSSSVLQQPGYPPISASQNSSTISQSSVSQQQYGFPPQPNVAVQQQGFGLQTNLNQSTPNFPPQPIINSPSSSIPPVNNSQQPGFPPMPNINSQQSGFQLQTNTASQLPGFPPQLSSQQPGYLQQQVFPSQSLPSQQSDYQQPGFPPTQGSYPPQQQNYLSQQPGYPQSTPAYMGQPAPNRRLDPDQMPSPVQVMEDDQQSKGGWFLTNQRGLVPPLVTTDFTFQDGGNASPRLIRSTMYCVPTTTDIMKQTSVPFGLVISPLAKTKSDEYPPPIINTGDIGPVRCKRCKAYMSPFMQFIDGGKHFVCLLCKASTEVPVEYFQHLDHTGQRLDRAERPELCFGSYEFVVPKEYCRKEVQPKPPAYVFVIDVSYNNMKSGLVRLICAFMKELLTQLPTELGDEKSKIRVGFITYDTNVHFYNIKETLAVPQMMVVGDTSEMFMPLLDGFLCDPEKSSHVIDALMEQIPVQFNETRTTDTMLYPAIKAGVEALKNADCCGKLFVFHSSLPIAEGPGKLKNREDRKLLATDKEKSILNPQTNIYNELGEECVQAGCSVDLFITNNSYIDLATVGQVSRISGGEIYKYTYFQAEYDGQRFLSDLKRNISRPTVFDAVMRVRTSTGVRPTDFYGHFYMSNTTDVELAAIDCDKAIAIEVKHDDKLEEQDGVLIQTAMLYTSCSGQRRVRILNVALRSSGQMGELYRSCDLDTIMNFFGKQVMYKILESSGRQVKDAIINKTAQILATYRKHCASPSSAGQLILPECMKLMPLYLNCLIKSDAMSGGPDMTVDDRWYNMHLVITADIPTTLGYFYPRLIPLHTLENETNLDDVSIPSQLRCSIEKFAKEGAYILENGVYMFLWLGMNLSQTFLSDVFGVHNISQINTERSDVPVMDNPLNKAIREIISKIQQERSHTMRLSILKQNDKIETVMRHFLVEDHGIDNSPSYVEFLCHMHKEIRNLLS
ncbi:protein transport protein Sec24D isoform X2 [Daktulosphaira vitifoliae]|uniref:protein transport protein Sec24D isoform X2 n=1 Tax=Daktulosphaira vitifoliae TaxID=58002 RepID=UPI0021AADDD4|nr:protein transport protein Sec24D isoform X2 [Daktulosphaira vitifoliae]